MFLTKEILYLRYNECYVSVYFGAPILSSKINDFHYKQSLFVRQTAL